MSGHIAIDGPAGSGKTTVARALAERLGILYLDSGAMYRAVALLAMQERVDADNAAAIGALARRRPLEVNLDLKAPLGFTISSGAQHFGDELYGNDVSAVASLVATHAGLRELLVARQQAIARMAPVVMAGRDIGTVVLPDAPLKVFLTASVESRVQRRLIELASHGSAIDPVVLRAQIVERDELDRRRAAAPLRKASDAVEIDSSLLSVDEVVAQVLSLAAAGAA